MEQALWRKNMTLTLFITCISSHFCMRRAEGNLFEVYKTHRPQYWKVWLFRCLVWLDRHLSWTVAMFSVCDLHDSHATGQPHIISLADILLAKWKKWFQRKTLKWGIKIMPQQYHSFWLLKWKSDPITDLRIRWHLKYLPTHGDFWKTQHLTGIQGKSLLLPWLSFWQKCSILWTEVFVKL